MPKKKTKKKSKTEECCCSSKDFKNMCNGGCLYFMGFVGAAVYYIQTATSFWMGVWGVIKALLWPAFLVYDALKYLGINLP